MKPERRQDKRTARGRERRRTYERPRIVSREPLEVLAVVCNPAFGGKPTPLECGITQS